MEKMVVFKIVFWAMLGCAVVLVVGGIAGKNLLAGFADSPGQFSAALEESLPLVSETKPLAEREPMASETKENKDFQKIAKNEELIVDSQMASTVVLEKVMAPISQVPVSQPVEAPSVAQTIQPVQVVESIPVTIAPAEVLKAEPRSVPPSGTTTGEESPVTYPAIRFYKVQIGSLVSEKDEFVKLYNPTSQNVDLAGWYLQRKTKTADSFSTYAPRALFEGKTIAGQGYFVIAREGMAATADIFVDAPLTEDNTLALKSPDGTIQDTYQTESEQLPEPIVAPEPAPEPAPEQTPEPSQPQDQLYYTSSYKTAKYYYPDSCNGWKSLSQNYLKAFNSLAELLAAYPSKTLSPGCK